jgi:hypothetical protein
VTATAVSTSQIQVTWTGSDTGGPGIKNYTVYRGSTLLSCTTSPCNDTGLTANTSYTYTVYIYDTTNDVGSGTATGTTSGTFQYVSGTHTMPDNTGDVVTATIKNSGAVTITAISYTCSGGSWYNTGSPPTSLAAGASGSYQCEAAASGSYTVTFTLSGTSASNSPFSTPSF